MMNLDQIATRIAAPDRFPASEIPAWKELTEKYPYAQVFSILYLKALSDQNDIGFDEALQKHAYKITDRMKLYDLIHGAQKAPEPANIPISAETQEEIPAAIPEAIQPESAPEAVTVPESLPEPEPQPEIIAHPEIAPVEVPEIETIQEEPTVTIPEAPKETEEAPVSETFEEQSPEEAPIAHEEHPDEEESLHLEIISHVVANVYSDNLETSLPKKADIETGLPEEKSQEVVEKEETPSPAEPHVPITSSRSFTSWLKAGNQPASPAQEPTIESKQETSQEAPKSHVDAIIEQFIKEEPTISRPKKEFYSPTKKAKESLNTEGLIYTETLANIFAIQGNFPKAILAYEQLMLTNPEKKIFFAQRIQELKEKLNT